MHNFDENGGMIGYGAFVAMAERKWVPRQRIQK
jgi:hypothetical protein